MKTDKSDRDRERFGPLSSKDVRKRSERIKRSRREGDRGFWQYLGLVGSVGWMVILPALGGAFLGRYIDVKAGDRISWTLTLLIVGLAAGCFAAWRHIREEQ